MCERAYTLFVTRKYLCPYLGVLMRANFELRIGIEWFHNVCSRLRARAKERVASERNTAAIYGRSAISYEGN